MNEEIKEVHIKSYDEWLKYYENATKEQVIEDLTQDVKYFADVVKDIKDLQEENERLNNIINELEKMMKNDLECAYSMNENGLFNGAIDMLEVYLDKLQELKGSDSNE